MEKKADLEYKTDIRFTLMQALKSIVGYLLGILIVLLCLHPKDMPGMVGASLLAGIVIFFIFFYPRKIIIRDGYISFVRTNSNDRLNIKLTDLTGGESINTKLYNTVMIITKSGEKYKLHPKHPEVLLKDIKNKDH